ncbi:hypothetical protein NMY22_g13808 [Coprinellus aureogranulatus]|nr:hypothetical protein NMY22_g13808 [Coprinellus aureogranulatus]
MGTQVHSTRIFLEGAFYTRLPRAAASPDGGFWTLWSSVNTHHRDEVYFFAPSPYIVPPSSARSSRNGRPIKESLRYSLRHVPTSTKQRDRRWKASSWRAVILESSPALFTGVRAGLEWDTHAYITAEWCNVFRELPRSPVQDFHLSPIPTRMDPTPMVVSTSGADFSHEKTNDTSFTTRHCSILHPSQQLHPSKVGKRQSHPVGDREQCIQLDVPCYQALNPFDPESPDMLSPELDLLLNLAASPSPGITEQQLRQILRRCAQCGNVCFTDRREYHDCCDSATPAWNGGAREFVEYLVAGPRNSGLSRDDLRRQLVRCGLCGNICMTANIRTHRCSALDVSDSDSD